MIRIKIRSKTKNMIKINENQCVTKIGRWYYLEMFDDNDVLVSKSTITKPEYDRAIRLNRFIADEDMTVGDRIIEILYQKKISQVELSKRTGIAQSCIADWKHKSTSPAANKIMAICEVLECTPEELLKGAK